jgi:hypothetical protein
MAGAAARPIRHAPGHEPDAPLMAEYRPIWTTADELNSILDMATNGNICAVSGWLHAAKTYWRNWGLIDRDVCIRYAERVLRAMQAGETVRAPFKKERASA